MSGAIQTEVLSATAAGPAQAIVEPGRVGGPAMKPPTPDDARAIRVSVAARSRHDTDPTIVLAPVAGGEVLLNGAPGAGLVEQRDAVHAIHVDGDGHRVRAILSPVQRRASDGVLAREVVIGGWRIDVEIESERRAGLRERARRAKDTVAKTGPVEVRAIIAGRIVAVSAKPGDAVDAGEQVLVLEAMKMQNELRSPRTGTVEKVSVAVGENVEVGDLLVVIS